MNINRNTTDSIGRGFWKFFFHALVSPIRRGYSVDGTQFIHGVIIYGIYSFLTGVNMFTQTLITRGAYEDEGISFFSSMILPFIFTAISLFIIAGIILVIALLMRSGAHYPDVVARFGSMLVIPTVISFVIFIFTVANAMDSLIYFFVSLLSMIGLFSAIAFTVYSFYNESKSGLDPFYAVLLTFIGIGFLAYVFNNLIFMGFFSFMV